MTVLAAFGTSLFWAIFATGLVVWVLGAVMIFADVFDWDGHRSPFPRFSWRHHRRKEPLP